MTRIPVRFYLGDDNERTWRGFTDGQTWNGWDQMYVTIATRDAIAAYCLAADGQEQVDDLMSMPITPDGLVDMNGWTTYVPTRARRLREAAFRAADRHARRLDSGASDALLRESDAMYRRITATLDREV